MLIHVRGLSLLHDDQVIMIGLPFMGLDKPTNAGMDFVLSPSRTTKIVCFTATKPRKNFALAIEVINDGDVTSRDYL